MITTPYGSHVKWVAMIDENRQLATVVGYQKQVATYAINALRSDGGVQEIRDSHQRYLEMRENQEAPEINADTESLN